MAQPGNAGEPNGAQDRVPQAANDDLAEDLGAIDDDDDDDDDEAENEAGNGNAIQGELLYRSIQLVTSREVLHILTTSRDVHDELSPTNPVSLLLISTRPSSALLCPWSHSSYVVLSSTCCHLFPSLPAFPTCHFLHT